MSALDITMRRYADEAVAAGRKLLTQPLDYSVATVAAVDGLIAGLAAEAAQLPDATLELQRVSVLYGAYVGEVIRQNGSGLWLQDVPGVMPGHVALCVGKEHVYPLATVADLLRGGSTTLDGIELSSVEAYVGQVLKSQSEWLHAMVLSGAPDVEQLRGRMCADRDLSAFLLNQCGHIVMTAALKWGVMLDFTEASLADVEDVLGVLHDGLKSATAEEKPSAANLRAMTIGFGVYLGEVMRRTMGGRWTDAEVEGQGKILRLVVGSAETYPLRKVEKRLTEGASENVRFYAHALKQLLVDPRA